MNRTPSPVWVFTLLLLAGCGSSARPPTLKDGAEAWKHLEGTWVSRTESGNSSSVVRLKFTPDRKLHFTSSLTGGVLPGALTNDIANEVLDVAVEKDEVLLTISGPRGKSAGPMSIRLVNANQIRMEDGPTMTREK